MSLRQSNSIYTKISRIFNGINRDVYTCSFEKKEYELYWLYNLPKSSHYLQNYILAKQKDDVHLGIIKISFNPEDIDELEKYSNDLTYKIDINKLNINTKIIIPNIYDDINIIWRYNGANQIPSGANQYWFIVSKDNFYGVLDENGKEILPVKFDEITLLDIVNGYVLCKEKCLHGILNLFTKEIIIPIIYDSITDSSNSFICVKVNKFGVLKPNCEELIPLIYDNIQKVKNGFICRIGDDYGFINDAGDTIIPFTYDEIKTIKDIPELLICSKEGKKGIFNEMGEIIIPVSYNDIFSLGSNRICAIENADSEECIIFSKEGKKKGITLKFDEIVYQYKTIFKVRRNGRLGLISEDGNILENYTDDSMKVMRTYWEYIDLFKAFENHNGKKL